MTLHKVHRSYTVKALRSNDQVHVSSRDRVLCPVRALVCYRKRVEGLSLMGPDKNLFRCFAGAKKGLPMKIHSVSYYLKQTVRLAYDLLEESSLTPSIKMHAHEICVISIPLAALKHVPIKEILAKAYWKSQSTFAKFYFKDLSRFMRKVRGG